MSPQVIEYCMDDLYATSAKSAKEYDVPVLSRPFDNRRQIAAHVGLALSPWQSGKVDHDQEVSKAGKSLIAYYPR